MHRPLYNAGMDIYLMDPIYLRPDVLMEFLESSSSDDDEDDDEDSHDPDADVCKSQAEEQLCPPGKQFPIYLLRYIRQQRV